jgi:hypothetical protein
MMSAMAETRTSPNGLRVAIERAGYYPTLVAEAVDTALGHEPITSYVVHQETTFDREEVRRHVTVLALTKTRMIVSHTDEHPPDSPTSPPHATTSTETVRLDRVGTIVVNRTVDDPARYIPGTPPREVVLTIGWGGVNRVVLEPASCSDPNCEADHGYDGSVSVDDLSVRVSEAADGADVVRQTLAFAAALTEATAAVAAGRHAR